MKPAASNLAVPVKQELSEQEPDAVCPRPNKRARVHPRDDNDDSTVQLAASASNSVLWVKEEFPEGRRRSIRSTTFEPSKATQSSSSSSLPAVYSKLNKENKETRILVLEAGAFDDDLACTLEVISLKSSPTPYYATLSYAWGDVNDTRPITVNGRSLLITYNLDRALRHLRRTDASLRLWADAICIDQTNVLERSQQVILMHDVYSLCSEAHIWLGEFHANRWRDELRKEDYKLATDRTAEERRNDDENVRRMCDDMFPIQRPPQKCVHRMSRKCHYDAFRLNGRGTLQEAFYALELVSSRRHGLPFLTRDSECLMRWAVAYDVIVWILSRPWWRRVWTLQEAVLPRVDQTCHIGHETISLKTIRSAAAEYGVHWLHEGCCRQLGRLLPGRMYSRGYTFLAFPIQLYLLHPTTDANYIDVKTVLQGARQRYASNPADYYYGLLGLLTLHFASIGDIVKPDYEKNLASVMSEATKLEIMRSKNLSALSVCKGMDITENEESLPSWTINLTQRSHTKPFQYWWQICTSKYDYEVDLESTSLPVTGVYLDSVGQVSAVTDLSQYLRLPEYSAEACSLSIELVTERITFLKDHNCHFSDDSIEGWRMILNGREPQGNGHLRDSYIGLVRKWWDGLQSPTPDLTTLSDTRKTVSSFQSTRLFTLSGHGCCGLGVKNCQPGDVVFGIQGCDWPVVLRKVQTSIGSESSLPRYHVVGCCQVPCFTYSKLFDGTLPKRKLLLV